MVTLNGRRNMTGKEAWSIVAPIISAHSVVRGGMTLIDEAYIVVYEALRRLDEEEKKKKDEEKRQ